jgi:hypothetical protein
MDDLDVIRLAVVDVIARKRIARTRMEVKGNLEEGGGYVQSGLPDPLQVSPSPKEQFFRGNTCPVEGMRGKNVRGSVETIPSMANPRAFER